MEIILKQYVENLGHKNDTVSVRPGYANNFLIPQGLATVATPSAKKVAAENIRQSAHKEAKFVADAQAVADQLAAETLSFTVKAKDGKLFGSITTTQISEALAAKGLTFDRKNISLEAIKTVGEYTATIKLYKAIVGSVKVQVKAEGEVEAEVVAE
ncbi:MAG: 50S ribosomal protein L9 [Rikenellaceae bacterium]